MPPEPQSKGEGPSADTAKMSLQGLLCCCCCAGLLASVAQCLAVHRAVAVASGLQLTVALAHGLPYRSEKFYDLSGSCTHLAVVATSLLLETRQRTARQLFMALAATVWITRLGTFLYSRILRDGKDVRFDNLKRARLAFLQVWAIQAVWVSITQLPVVLINNREDVSRTTVADLVAMCAWCCGFLIEAVADMQKAVFRDDPANRHSYITTGLWRFSRHPNYFGEILMWSTMAFLASSAGFSMGVPALHAAWLSPAFTAFLLLRVSGVPLVEKSGLKKWGADPAYLQYMSGTSCVVPWFPARALIVKAD